MRWGLLFIILFLAPAESQGSDSLAAMVPEDAHALIRIPSLGNAWSGFQTLPLYQAYRDEEVQTFIESFGENIDDLAPGLKFELVQDLMNLPQIFDGEAALAVMQRDKNSLGWILSLVAKKNPQAAGTFVNEVLNPFIKTLLPVGPATERFGDDEVTVFKGPSYSLFLHLAGGRLTVTGWKEGMQDFLNRQKERMPSLADHKNYQETAKDGSFLIYTTLEGIWNQALEEMNEKERAVLNASGVDGLQSVSASLIMADGRAKDAIRLDIPGEKRGFFQIFADTPVMMDLARLAPDNTLLLTAANVRFDGLYGTILDMEKASPDSAVRDLRQSADELAEKLGLRSFSDVVGLLGTEIMLFTALPKGGGLIPETVMALEVLEPDKLQTNLFGLVATLAGAEPKTVTYRNRQIHYIPLSREGPFELNVCWCLTDGYLFVSHHPSILKGLVRRVDQGTGNLKKDAEFQASWKELPPNSVAVAYANTRRIFEFIYGLILPVSSMMGSELPFEPALMPTAEAISSYLSFGLSGITVDDGGIWVQTESDGYGPTSMVMYGITIAYIYSAYEDLNRSVEAWPSCGWTQKRIYEQMEAYRLTNGTYPADLAKDLEEVQWHYCHQATEDQEYEGTEKPPLVDFVYLVTEKKLDPPESFAEDWMILWDSKPRHNGGRIILLGSGEIIWLIDEDFQKRLEEQMK